MQEILVKSGQGDYRLRFFENLGSVLELINTRPNVLVLLDKNIASTYADDLLLIQNKAQLVLDASEDSKNFDNLKQVLNFFQGNRANKGSQIVAIGGGIIQDIATFCSHIYFRGLNWVFIPTTLLSMCDSSIGAKCGINLNEYKNQIGVFHSPSEIFVVTDFLDTLSTNDLRSGYGEILKHYLIESWDHFHELENNLETQGLRNPQIAKLIYDSVEIKRKIVEQDEYEGELRKILNYGHSFGHAIEPLSNFSVAHGLAVAWGIDLINYIAFKRGYMSKDCFLKIHKLIDKHFSIDLEEKITARQLIEFAKTDKKVKNGKINLVFLNEPGKFQFIETAFDEALEREISEYLENYNIIKSTQRNNELSSIPLN